MAVQYCKSYCTCVTTLSLSMHSDIYYSTWAGDRLFTKAFVSSIVLLETLQTALMGADLFRIYGSGSGSGDLQSLVAIGFSWLSVPLLTGLSPSSPHLPSIRLANASANLSQRRRSAVLHMAHIPLRKIAISACVHCCRRLSVPVPFNLC